MHFQPMLLLQKPAQVDLQGSNVQMKVLFKSLPWFAPYKVFYDDTELLYWVTFRNECTAKLASYTQVLTALSVYPNQTQQDKLKQITAFLMRIVMHKLYSQIK